MNRDIHHLFLDIFQPSVHSVVSLFGPYLSRGMESAAWQPLGPITHSGIHSATSEIVFQEQLTNRYEVYKKRRRCCRLRKILSDCFEHSQVWIWLWPILQVVSICDSEDNRRRCSVSAKLITLRRPKHPTNRPISSESPPGFDTMLRNNL